MRHHHIVFLLTCFFVVSQFSLAQTPARTDSSASPPTYGQWLGALGASGLRRSQANGSDLGELINRGVTYKTGKQKQRIYLANPLNGGSLSGFDFVSEADGYVAQTGSLMAVDPQFGRHTAIDFTLRTALRRDDDIDAQSDRLDLGMTWSANYFAKGAGYFSVNGIYERTDADIKYINGERTGDAWGARLQTGEVLSPAWAWSLRAERVWWSGDGYIYRPSASGPLRIDQDVDYDRTYFNTEVIGRYRLANFLFGPAQLRWRSGVHWLAVHYEDQINSLGQAAIEAFGPNERLGIVRTGAYIAWSPSQNWSPYTEWIYDYEFENNMNEVVDDPHTVSVKLGLARLLGPGKRIQLELQRFQGLKGQRVRNGLNLTAVIDF